MIYSVNVMDSIELDAFFYDLPPVNADEIKDVRKEPVFVKLSLLHLYWYILQGNKFNINGELDIEFLGYFYNFFTGDLELNSFYLSDLKSVNAQVDTGFRGCIDDVV